jgi:hypothetical protein
MRLLPARRVIPLHPYILIKERYFLLTLAESLTDEIVISSNPQELHELFSIWRTRTNSPPTNCNAPPSFNISNAFVSFSPLAPLPQRVRQPSALETALKAEADDTVAYLLEILVGRRGKFSEPQLVVGPITISPLLCISLTMARNRLRLT